MSLSDSKLDFTSLISGRSDADGTTTSQVNAPSTILPPDSSILSAIELPAITSTVSKIFPDTTSVYVITITGTYTAQTSAFTPTTSNIAPSSNVVESSSGPAAAATSSTSSTSSNSSSNNLSTIIPAVVAPVAFIMILSLILFWYFMRRRYRRELSQQPDFVMAGKGEMLSSTSESSPRSGQHGHGPAEGAGKKPAGMVENKNIPASRVRRISSHELKEMNSYIPLNPPPKYSPEEIGIARALTQADQRPPTSGNGSSRPQNPYVNHLSSTPRSAPRPPGPQTARNFNRPGPPLGLGTTQIRERSRSSPGNRPVIQGSNSNLSLNTTTSPSNHNRPPTAPSSQTSRSPWSAGPDRGIPRSLSPTITRAKPPTPISLPPTGAFNGGSAISQYSPIVKDTPDKRQMISPGRDLEMSFADNPKSSFPTPLAVQTQNLNKSPKRPKPLPRSPFADPPKSGTSSSAGHDLSEENLHIARQGSNSRLDILDDYQNDRDDDQISEVSDAETHLKGGADAKSEVSSLDEHERFDFERDLNSRSGSGVGSRSGTGTPLGLGGTGGYDSPWSLEN